MRISLRALISIMAMLIAASVSAQQAPMPPLIKVIVPFSPGASTDVIARTLATQLGPKLGTTVIVENRPGASGFIGATAVAKGPRDGSMLLFTSVSMISAATTNKNVPIDVLKDLVPVAIPGEGPLVFAVPATSPINNPADLLAAARAKPDVLTHGTGGVGTIAHMAVELLNEEAHIQLRHIPYKGASLAVTDMLGGTIDMMVAVKSTFGGHVNAGKFKLVAVTSLQPSPAFPGVPTIASVVPGYEVTLFTTLYAPAGTPAPVVQRINQAVNEISKSKEMTELMLSDGALPLTVTPEQAARKVRDAYATWKKLAVAKNIVTE
jgi:tripartite-type tricarboxylate transporter receptor subunit TctC